DGTQFFKAETKGTFTPKVSLVGRPYFEGVKAGEFWSIPGSGEFVVNPGRSIVDGKYYTFLAMRSAMREENSTQRAVALISLDLQSASSQPLPAGYSFAVVNREGHALYENDQRSALREDFIEEVEQPFRLSAALQGDHDRTIKLTYQTKPHRFHVRPL